MTDAYVPAAYLAKQVRGRLADWSHLPASRQVRAMLCWGLGQTPAIPAGTLRDALRGVTGAIDRELAPGPWRAHLQGARQRVKVPGSPPARGDIASSVADGLLGRTCSDHTSSRSSAHLSARRVAALVAVQVLRDLAPAGRGYDTVLTTADDMAVALGMSRRAVVDAQDLAVEAGWMGKVRAHRGRPTRFRPAKQARGGAVRRRLAAGGDLEEAAAAMARLDDDYLLVAVLASVDHPGWSVHWLGQRAWTVALAHAMGHEDGPAAFGMSRPTVRAARADLARMGLGLVQEWTADMGRALLAALDRAADEAQEDGRTAREVRTAALEARRLQVAERAASRRAYAEEQAAVRTAAQSTTPAADVDQSTVRPAEAVQAPAVESPPAQVTGRWVRLPVGYDDAVHRAALDSKLKVSGQRAAHLRVDGDRTLAYVAPFAAAPTGAA